MTGIHLNVATIKITMPTLGHCRSISAAFVATFVSAAHVTWNVFPDWLSSSELFLSDVRVCVPVCECRSYGTYNTSNLPDASLELYQGIIVFRSSREVAA